MTNRSKVYFGKKKRFSSKSIRKVFEDLFSKMPIPGSVNISRLEGMPYLKSLGEKVETMGPNENGRYTWYLPEGVNYPTIINIGNGQ